MSSGKVIQRSYVLPNNRLSIYKKKNSYSVRVEPGETYNMKYVIKDVSGNTSEMVFSIVGDEPGGDKSNKKKKMTIRVTRVAPE